ncbi:MAG TPA: hypothetical protein VN222_01385, partial [Novosphingobium sp.]|nr:hypothetical protein [Novosphingobium sp.]
AEARASLPAGITAKATLTWQRARLSAYRYTDASSGVAVIVDNNGHVPQRMPDIMASASLRAALRQGLQMGADLTFMGRRYADDGNSVRLPPFFMLGMDAQVDLGRQTRLSGRVSNLFDTIAVMQGDAIAGSVARGAYVVGRALPGRTFTLALARSF